MLFCCMWLDGLVGGKHGFVWTYGLERGSSFSRLRFLQDRGSSVKLGIWSPVCLRVYRRRNEKM